ncbi:MAG: retroviral-like aspartic protease family protein [Candidatus Hermodarchaeota archaeon]
MQKEVDQKNVKEMETCSNADLLPFILVRINNSEKVYEFHLDIGARKTTIFTTLAEELGIEVDKNLTQTCHSALSEMQIPTALIKSLSVGSEVLINLEVFVANMRKAGYTLKAVGALGYDFLKNYRVHVNFPKKTINFVKDDAKALESLINFNYFNDTHLVSIKANINDSGPYWFVLDTGASGNIMTASLAEKLNIASDEIIGEAVTCSGRSPLKLAQANKFETFFKTVYNMDFATMNLDHFNAKGLQKIGGILGHPFLKEFELVIDYPHQKLGLLKTN